MKASSNQSEQYKILVVNDDVDNLNTIVSNVEKSNQNYLVLQSNSAEIALDIASGEIPDLIITDWDMPQMNGIELIKALKKSEITKDIPIIMATAVMTTPENLKTALDAGAVDYIRIPVDKIELSARVYSMLELSQSYKQIKSLNGMKDKLFSIIAHDLRNPFNTLLTYSRILVRRIFKLERNEIESQLLLINKSAEKAYSLLEDLLLWSRSQRDVIRFNPEQVDLAFIVEESIELFTSSCREKNIEVVLNIDAMPTLYADMAMINTVVRNLLSNAIKFTPNGGKILFSKGRNFSLQEADQKQFVEIIVSDTGKGISSEDIKKLFRIDISYTTLGTAHEKGTGLGLILCKEFVEKHGGNIRVESDFGKGSRFIFTMPVFQES